MASSKLDLSLSIGTKVVELPSDQMLNHFDKFAVRLVNYFAKEVEYLCAL
jgi:hypothetical protein